jgi:hypothetical protein
VIAARRWLEVSVPCPCGRQVHVYSKAEQPADSSSPWLEQGDVWRCEGGHFGNVYIGAAIAHLGPPHGEGLSAVTADFVEAQLDRHDEFLEGSPPPLRGALSGRVG